MHYLIGIDEAGRGPWAGPVVVGGWMADFTHAVDLLSSLEGLTDSKILPQIQREKLYHEIEKMQDESRCQYAFAYRDADMIDATGIRESNRECMQDVIMSLMQYTSPDDHIDIYIDGCDNYRFDLSEDSIGYVFQKLSREKSLQMNTMTGLERIQIYYRIGGDKSISAVSAGSIIAKVVRDRMMCEYSEDFPEYGFDAHKGYGTRRHREALLSYGITPLHRKSYDPMRSLILGTAGV